MESHRKFLKVWVCSKYTYVFIYVGEKDYYKSGVGERKKYILLPTWKIIYKNTAVFPPFKMFFWHKTISLIFYIFAIRNSECSKQKSWNI